MMRRSFNEISGMMKRAAMGAGLPAGLAEDAGRAAAWLCQQGMDGAAIALKAVLSAEGQGGCRFDAASGVFDQATAAIAGPSALDMACAGRRVGLRRTDVPAFVAGLAGVAASDRQVAFTLEGPSGNSVLITPHGIVEAEPLPAAASDLTLYLAQDARFPQNDPEPASGGADVDPETWTGIAALAARTFVPASEASRAHGAGAGMTDND